MAEEEEGNRGGRWAGEPLGALPSQMGQIEDAPRNDRVKQEAVEHGLMALELERLDAAAGFQNAVKDLDIPTPQIEGHDAPGRFRRGHFPAREQQPAQGLFALRRIDLLREQRPKRNRGQLATPAQGRARRDLP